MGAELFGHFQIRNLWGIVLVIVYIASLSHLVSEVFMLQCKLAESVIIVVVIVGVQSGRKVTSANGNTTDGVLETVSGIVILDQSFLHFLSVQFVNVLSGRVREGATKTNNFLSFPVSVQRDGHLRMVYLVVQVDLVEVESFPILAGHIGVHLIVGQVLHGHGVAVLVVAHARHSIVAKVFCFTFLGGCGGRENVELKN